MDDCDYECMRTSAAHHHEGGCAASTAGSPSGAWYDALKPAARSNEL